MNMRELVLKTRSYRRFHEHEPVSEAVLRELVELARLSASAGNKQPLKYLLSCDPETNARIFPHLRWAAYLPDWGGPREGERPAAYIVVLNDTTIAASCGCDHGIAAQTIMLAATEAGLGGCILGAVDRDALRRALGIPGHLEIMLVLALGKPREIVMLEPMQDGDVRYWRDAAGHHHVPKRSLPEVLVRPNPGTSTPAV